MVGRDQPDQRLYLSKDQESLVWDLDHAENELWKQPPDPVLESVAKIVSSEKREWEGSSSELAQVIQNGHGSEPAHQASECECWPLTGRTSGEV